MEIFHSFRFEAAHRLPLVPKDHKCYRLHGHSYQVTLHVDAPVDEEQGWVIDFAEIEEAFRPTLERLHLPERTRLRTTSRSWRAGSGGR
jgi:6-pyruvoyltetrahydropterin/6-carboxytetrahydropterin synthase